MYQILIVEDNPAMGKYLVQALEMPHVECHLVTTGYEAMEQVKTLTPDIIVLDLTLPDCSGFEVIEKSLKISNQIEIIVVSGHSDAKTALKAIKLGAKDYIVKPFSKERIAITISNLIETLNLSKQLSLLKGTTKNNAAFQFYDIVGASSNMQQIYKTLDMMANNNESIIIYGESGSGKKLCARTIHSISSRKSNPFIPYNAKHHNHNAHHLFEEALKKAQGGTLYIANLTMLDAQSQMSLLVALDDENINVRFISSDEKGKVDKLLNDMHWRNLLYRINILSLTIPALRSRGSDIKLLASHFLDHYSRVNQKSFGSFDHQILEIFSEYHWPGNVRELENTIKNIVLMNDSTEVITKSMLPQHFQPDETIENAHNSDSAYIEQLFQGNQIVPIRDLEQMAILHALEVCDGNVQEAAVKLKISPATLYRKKPN